jgi:phage anti-repressor protein
MIGATETGKEVVSLNDVQAVEIPKITEYKGKRVLTSSQLAECYGVDRKRLTYNFNHNKDRFKECVHYMCLEGEEKREFINRNEFPSGYQNAGKLYLWSERGVLLHAKSLNTDRAWEVYERLIDFYFQKRQQSAAVSSGQLREGDVLASELYSYLGLSRGNYPQWVERNITGNRFAVEGLDYRYIGGNDFILSQSLTRCVCMMSKTDEGERCRQDYIRRIEEHEAVLSALGIRRKEQLTMAEMEQRQGNPLVGLDFSRCSAIPPTAAGLSDKRMLSLKEFCTYSGLGRTKARSYAEEKGLIVRIGRRILVDRLKFDRLCDDLKA